MFVATSIAGLQVVREARTRFSANASRAASRVAMLREQNPAVRVELDSLAWDRQSLVWRFTQPVSGRSNLSNGSHANASSVMPKAATSRVPVTMLPGLRCGALPRRGCPRCFDRSARRWLCRRGLRRALARAGWLRGSGLDGRSRGRSSRGSCRTWRSSRRDRAPRRLLAHERTRSRRPRCARCCSRRCRR